MHHWGELPEVVDSVRKCCWRQAGRRADGCSEGARRSEGEPCGDVGWVDCSQGRDSALMKVRCKGLRSLLPPLLEGALEVERRRRLDPSVCRRAELRLVMERVLLRLLHMEHSVVLLLVLMRRPRYTS